MENEGLLIVVRRSLRRVMRIFGVLVLLSILCVVYARFIEPHWLRVRHITLSANPGVRVIHISDIHYDGNKAYLDRVVRVINETKADVVCFTGDLIEEKAFEKEALQVLGGINKPLYGVVGNHDQWVLKSFEGYRDAFRRTGGELLTNQVVLLPSCHVALLSMGGLTVPVPPGYRRILLEHYPGVVAGIRGEKLDLMLTGHTHGGQARVPFMNRSFLPIDLGLYDKGLFQAPCGQLYVNPGIGTYYWKVRFLCRPEVTVIEI